MSRSNEFDLIEHFFKKPTKRVDVNLGIGDDCAVLRPFPGLDLVVTTDTLVEGRHFLSDTDPKDIGYKSVAVSLSDIAAMGAQPSWLLLSLTMPDVITSWLEGFTQGMFACLDEHQIDLVGGNLSKGPLSITTQLIGQSDPGCILTRSGALSQDYIFVTGPIGDCGLAIKLLTDQIEDKFTPVERDALTHRLWHPIPRIKEGRLLQQVATAAIDISDGLVADLKHILEQSQVGATLYTRDLPISGQLKKISEPSAILLALTAGDDYELCFTVSPNNLPELQKLASEQDCSFFCIGKINEQQTLTIVGPDNKPMTLENEGFKHF